MQILRTSLINTGFVWQFITKLFITGILLFLCFAGSTQTLSLQEYKVKAAFIFNFTKFLEWPPAFFDSSQAPFVIAIVGDDPFGSLIDEIVSGEKVKGHPMIVQRHKQIKDIEHCHLIFIGAKQSHVEKIIFAEIPHGVLTVSDIPEFNAEGGMIRFATIDNKIKLVINPAAVKAAELTISSKLLNVAQIYVR